MSERTLTVQKSERFVPWRAVPDSDTTVAELQSAVDALGLCVVNDPELGIVLIMASMADTPPSIEVLADALFGVDSNPTLVEESGIRRTPDLFDQEARERHAEHDSEQ